MTSCNDFPVIDGGLQAGIMGIAAILSLDISSARCACLSAWEVRYESFVKEVETGLQIIHAITAVCTTDLSLMTFTVRTSAASVVFVACPY